MEFIEFLFFVVCFVPIAIFTALFVTVVWMKNGGYKGVAIILTVFGIILVPIGLGISFIGYQSLEGAHDTTEEDSIQIHNHTVHSVTENLRRGDRIEISFMSTIPLDVIIRRKVTETCEYEDVYGKSKILSSNSESDSMVYTVEETTIYSVTFEGSGEGSGFAEITVTFDRSSSRHMGILTSVAGCLLVGGSLVGFFWVRQNGKHDGPVIPVANLPYQSGPSTFTNHQISSEFPAGTVQFQLAKTRYARYRDRRKM